MTQHHATEKNMEMIEKLKAAFFVEGCIPVKYHRKGKPRVTKSGKNFMP